MPTFQDPGFKPDFLKEEIWKAQSKFGLVRAVRNMYILREAYFSYKDRDLPEKMAEVKDKFYDELAHLEEN